VSQDADGRSYLSGTGQNARELGPNELTSSSFNGVIASCLSFSPVLPVSMRACTLLLLLTHLLVCAQAEPCPHDAYISVIYNCLIWPDQDWASLITYQLEHLMRTGIADCATIHVVMSIPASHTNLTYDELESLLGEGRQLVRSILPVRQSTKITGTLLSQVHENSFEYPGLHLLWLLAQVCTSHCPGRVHIHFTRDEAQYGKWCL